MLCLYLDGEILQPPDPINPKLPNRKFLDFLCKFMHLIDDSEVLGLNPSRS